ncbi:MAG: thioredoxin protein [Rhodoglobus sp.]|nr:thioredoxin protein [Rhodoglobus sp.]
MPNRLANAASPYLRSHAENPVDWWAWGPEPFAEAARRDVPVFVSIGYSTCHWCHVMARESFSDPAIAEVMNKNLVSIKVDREEHAEVDATYLAAAAAFTRDLGWPLNVFVTPQGRMFFAGTYWPPTQVGDHPPFASVLGAVLEAWNERRADIERSGAAIVEALAHLPDDPVAADVDFDAVVGALEGYEDTEFGGFGTSPKFPVAPVLRFLVSRDGRSRALATRTLDAMASSALRDLDGGFFRYATRRDWTEPHYERMLYDNGQLLASYALAGRPEVAGGIADFLLGTMQLPGGGFASAQDSESTVDGVRVEGEYYLLDAGARRAQPAPALDEKVLTGWNGLAIEGLAIAGTLFERPEWIAAARRSADFLLEHHVLPDRLVRASIGGVLSDAPATLEDHGMLASGLLHLATATGEVRYAAAARSLVDGSLGDGDFRVPDGQDPVLAAQGIVMTREESDGAYPSGSSAMASAAHRLYLLTAHARYRVAAEAAMARLSAAAVAQPASYGSALAVLSALAEPVRQLVVVGKALGPIARHWRGGLSSVVSTGQAEAFARAGFELYAGRSVEAAYVCENFVCYLPVTTEAELLRLL